MVSQITGIFKVGLKGMELQKIFSYSLLHWNKSMWVGWVHQLLNILSCFTWIEVLKKLLKIQRQAFVSLEKWELSLGHKISPNETFAGFKNLLCWCKVNTFWEVNFKILHRILATLKVISHTCHDPAVAKCHWCPMVEANINPILLSCLEAERLYILLDWISVGGGY